MEQDRISRRYRIESVIGTGRFAHVYLGHDNVLGRTVAIKVLRDEVSIDSAASILFTRAAQAAARLVHPHIVDIYDVDVGEHGGEPFIVMEFVPGQTLAQIIREEAPFHPDEVAALVEQVATALDHAHDRGVVHGALSSSNILVDQNGFAKVADFGLGRAVRNLPALQADKIEDVVYLAPEVLKGQAATSASDVYSLGVIAFEMLTGRRPNTSNFAAPFAVTDHPTEPIGPFRRDSVLQLHFRPILYGAMSALPNTRDRSAGQFSTRLTDWRSSANLELSAPPRRLTNTVSDDDTTTQTRTVEPPLPVLNWGEQHSYHSGQRARLPQRKPTVARWVGSGALLVVLLMALATANPFEGIASRLGSGLLAQPEGTSPRSRTEENRSDLTAPDVRGLSIEAARGLLAERGIQLREDLPIFSPEVQKGAIAEQEPSPGSALTSGQTVFVRPSRGAPETDIATLALEGESAERARARLAEHGLNVVMEDHGSPSVPEGTVVEVSPKTPVAVGDTVTLVVSVGDKVQVPREAFGSGLESASADLRASGLQVGHPIAVDRLTIERQIDLDALDIEPGEVVGVQNPAGDANFGAWVDRGTQVTLVYYDPSLD